MPQPQPQGFLAAPATGKGPGLMVLHPWWGLNANMKALCGRLATEGFLTFAPDLYHGKIAATIKDAKVLSRELDETRAKSDIADAVTFLSERADLSGQGLGLIGFSLGAYTTCRARLGTVAGTYFGGIRLAEVLILGGKVALA